MNKVSDIATPLLSVVVPIYGVEEYLGNCIESIIEQSYKNLDIILVDDGSKGKEGEICDKYAELDTRIRVIHKKNAGLVAARKTGIKEAKGEYITFVDGDDFISQDYYLKMMGIMIEKRPDLVASGFTQYYSSEKFERIQQEIKSGVYEGDRLKTLFENLNCKEEKYFVFSVFPSTCLKIYKTGLLESNAFSVPEGIKIGEDSAFSYPYILSCKKIIIDNENSGYFYRAVDNSMVRIRDDSLLVQTNNLYAYLKPFYYTYNNEKITRQLELYRIYMLNLYIDWIFENEKLSKVHKLIKKLKKLDNEYQIFDDIRVGDYILPKVTQEAFSLLTCKKWRLFQLFIVKRISRRNAGYIAGKVRLRK